MIEVQELEKTFWVHKKEPGLMGSIRSLFARETFAKEAVKGVSFSVSEGEIVGLIGANGAGKTTIVKMLAGIVHPSGGKARVLGHEPWKREDSFRRQIALIMGQKAQLWWDLPAADCFLLLQEIYQIPEARFRETLGYLSEVLDIGAELNVQIRRLSLGERMKMELIAALLHSPRVVYLDEPTIGLDLTAQRAIREFLLGYREEHAPAMLLTSHYMEDIQKLCKRILVIREGDLVFDGPLDEVVARFAPQKRVTLHLDPEREVPADFAPEKHGEVIVWDPTQLQIRVARDQVAEVSAALLTRLPAKDLAIDEEDIGTIIERIMGSDGAPA